MSTERQKHASRANGSRSHGPVTSAGKLASCRNAITHGMLSTTIVLNGESTDRFLGLLATLFEEFQPQTPFEESLIENMAVARWRQMRIWGLEKAGLDHEMLRQSQMSSFPALDPADDSSAAATRASIAFRTLSDDSRSLELINRYDSRFDRQYYRAHRRFIETRDRRTPPPAPTPQLVPMPATPAPPAVPLAPSQATRSGTPDGRLIPTPGVAKIEALVGEPEKADISKRTRELDANKSVTAQVRRTANTSGHTPGQSRVRYESVFIRFHPWPMFLTFLALMTRRNPDQSAAIIPLQHNPAF